MLLLSTCFATSYCNDTRRTLWPMFSSGEYPLPVKNNLCRIFAYTLLFLAVSSWQLPTHFTLPIRYIYNLVLLVFFYQFDLNALLQLENAVCHLFVNLHYESSFYFPILSLCVLCGVCLMWTSETTKREVRCERTFWSI